MQQNSNLCEMYRIWAGGHYATICINNWSDEDSASFGGELLVHSSLGDFGGVIEGCSVPVVQHLRTMELEAFLMAFQGAAQLTFDAEQSRDKLKAAIITGRRQHRLPTEVACEVWGDLRFSADDTSLNEEQFSALATRLCNLAPALGAPESYLVRTASPKAALFWRAIWPKFISKLQHHPTTALQLVA